MHFPFVHHWENVSASERVVETFEHEWSKSLITLVSQRCSCGQQRVARFRGWWEIGKGGALVAVKP